MGSHFMLNVRNKHTAERERILADGIKEIVAELRLVEAIDYVAFIRMDCFGNIADIVNSSSQLYLKPGALRFSNEGEVHLTWSSVPAVDLGMEFRSAGVVAHFRLGLTAVQASVTITYISFADGAGEPDADTAKLLQAVNAARLDWRRND